MTPATGFQIAFLLLVAHLFPAIGSIPMARAFGWSDLTQQIVSQSVAFAIIAAVIVGISRLRRQCVSALRRPVPRELRSEVIGVTIAKCTTPFAVFGAIFLYETSLGSPAAIAAQMKVPDPSEMWDVVLSPIGMVRMVVLGWIVAPILEELVFRGFLYHAWERQWGWFPSMLLTSTCFAIAHPSHMASTFIGSVVFVCLMRRTGTLLAPVVAHALFNILISWPVLGQLLFRAPQGPPGDLSTWWAFLACLAFVSAALPAYLWISRDSTRAAGVFVEPSRF